MDWKGSWIHFQSFTWFTLSVVDSIVVGEPSDRGSENRFQRAFSWPLEGSTWINFWDSLRSCLACVWKEKGMPRHDRNLLQRDNCRPVKRSSKRMPADDKTLFFIGKLSTAAWSPLQSSREKLPEERSETQSMRENQNLKWFLLIIDLFSITFLLSISVSFPWDLLIGCLEKPREGTQRNRECFPSLLQVFSFQALAAGRRLISDKVSQRSICELEDETWRDLEWCIGKARRFISEPER